MRIYIETKNANHVEHIFDFNISHYESQIERGFEINRDIIFENSMSGSISDYKF